MLLFCKYSKIQLFHSAMVNFVHMNNEFSFDIFDVKHSPFLEILYLIVYDVYLDSYKLFFSIMEYVFKASAKNKVRSPKRHGSRYI